MNRLPIVGRPYGTGKNPAVEIFLPSIQCWK